MNRGELLDFLGRNHQAVIASIKPDGSPHVVPVFCGLVDDAVWISGTAGRARTRFLRENPMCAVTVFAPGDWFHWATVQGRCTVKDDDGFEDNLRLYQVITGHEPDDIDAYRKSMIEDRRLVYVVGIERWYP